MKLLIKYLKPFFGRMTLGLMIKILGTIMDLLIPYILEHIIDKVIPLGAMKPIFFWGILMIVCSVGGLAGNIIANRMASAVARDATREIRHDLFTRISYLSSKQIDEITIPTLETRLTSDTYNIHHMTGMMQRIGVRAPILLIGGVAMTFVMEPVLALVMVSVLPLITAAVMLISKKGIPLFKAQQQRSDDMVQVVRESAQGIRVIKALSKTDYEKNKFEERNLAVSAAERKSAITMGLTSPLMNAFLNVGMAAVILVGAYRVNGGKAEAGMVIAFMSYFTIILNAMLSITRMFTLYSKGAASAIRIAEVMETPSDLAVSDDRTVYDSESIIRFDDVSFSYNGMKRTLSDIDFSLKKGQTLGIIGATGSGKSTLIQLLLRFYDVDSGRVLVDGRDVRSYEPTELRAKFGTALQSDFIFSGTVLENIDFGRNLDMSGIESAADAAQAKEFISALDDGYGYMLNSKGTNLSGGQRQRVLISRALAAKPEILILDDSSSALDYKTDSKLRADLRAGYAEATKVIIAQRVSSIAHADMILVIDKGRIIGKGTHGELLSSCPEYREISDSQIGGTVE